MRTFEVAFKSEIVERRKLKEIQAIDEEAAALEFAEKEQNSRMWEHAEDLWNEDYSVGVRRVGESGWLFYNITREYEPTFSARLA